ncbi:MAG: hypothetical protein CUN54_07880 [Phototrophicales bacterium]|nr:MAG: hypothetical protein CUN54_07880 [Phototrophicales bacterium]
MSALPQDNWSVQAYLDYEQASDIRHEFMDGQIYAMAGASERHNQLASALNYLLYRQFLERPCQVFQSDMRVRANESVYFYPDVVALCGEADYSDDSRDTLQNPSVVIEVLSPSTEDFDRGRKFTQYRQIASLKDYILVSQNQMQIEHYTRQTTDSWLLTVMTHAEDELVLPSIDCVLALSDIYRKVTFEGDK